LECNDIGTSFDAFGYSLEDVRSKKLDLLALLDCLRREVPGA